LNADAFHSKHASVGPSIVDCIARFNGDDSVNICGDYHLITSASNWSTASKDNFLFCELRVLAKNNDGNGINIRVGDRVELTTYSGMRLNDAPVVLSVLPDGEITDKELEFVKHQSIDKTIKTKGLKRAFRIQLRAAGSITPTSTTACNDLPTSRYFFSREVDNGITHCINKSSWKWIFDRGMPFWTEPFERNFGERKPGRNFTERTLRKLG